MVTDSAAGRSSARWPGRCSRWPWRAIGRCRWSSTRWSGSARSASSRPASRRSSGSSGACGAWRISASSAGSPQPLTALHLRHLEALLQGEPALQGRTRLSWLREAPEIASARSLRKVLERLGYLRGLGLPAPDPQLHPNRLRQLARRCAQYPVQPLARFAAAHRYALLAAYLPDLLADLTDQALDMLDKLLGELLRKGERKQEAHFHTNAKLLNSHLAVLTAAGEALLTARREDRDPFAAVFAVVPEATLAATVAASKQLVRPLDFNARDLISREYAHARGPLLALYDALEVRAVQGTHPALEALAHVHRLGAHQRRVTRRRQTLGGETVDAPLGHVTERWRRLVYAGRRRLNAPFYELAALEALKDGLRAGDLYVFGEPPLRQLRELPAPARALGVAADGGPDPVGADRHGGGVPGAPRATRARAPRGAAPRFRRAGRTHRGSGGWAAPHGAGQSGPRSGRAASAPAGADAADDRAGRPAQ